jgi:hypothetical protein
MNYNIEIDEEGYPLKFNHQKCLIYFCDSQISMFETCEYKVFWSKAHNSLYVLNDEGFTHNTFHIFRHLSNVVNSNILQFLN